MGKLIVSRGALHAELLLTLGDSAHRRQFLQLLLRWPWWRMLHHGEDVRFGLGGGLIERIWRNFQLIKILIKHFGQNVLILSLRLISILSIIMNLILLNRGGGSRF